MKKFFFIFMFVSSVVNATPVQIRDLTVVSITGTKIVLTCTVPAIRSSIVGSGPTKIDQIELRMDTASNRLTTTNYSQCKVVIVNKDPGPAGTKLTLTAEGLLPNTRYYFACKAFDTVWGPPSNVVNGTTTNTPTRPDNKIIRSKWTLKDDGGEQPQYIVISHGHTPAMTEPPIILPGDRTHYDITGLKWGVRYYWNITTVLGNEMKIGPDRSDSQ